MSNTLKFQLFGKLKHRGIAENETKSAYGDLPILQRMFHVPISLTYALRAELWRESNRRVAADLRG
jgi:hypothetical protein